MKTVNLKVSGMVCHGCENRIINALKNLNGVNDVSASFESGTVTVSASDEIKENIIKETVEDLGFDVES